MYRSRSKRRRASGSRGDEQASTPSGRTREPRKSEDSAGPMQAAGPAVALRAGGPAVRSREGGAEETEPALSLRGTESSKHVVHVAGNGATVRLEGETEATFDGGSSQIVNQRVRRATGCENCEDDGCIRVTGTLVLRYRVTTVVTLPSVNDFPDLTPCQRRRVQDAIDNVLAPHEQEHVQAFETYNGTSRHPFDFKVCSAEEANERLQEIHDTDAATREANAQALSDALDPFHFDVDLDCEDEPPEQGAGQGAGEPAAPESESPQAEAPLGEGSELAPEMEGEEGPSETIGATPTEGGEEEHEGGAHGF